MVICRDPIFMGEIKHLNQIFFCFHACKSISLNTHSCHPKFVHMQQETIFYAAYILHKYLHRV
jgi:hypothetical protein